VWADAILGETMSRTPIILDTGNKDLLGFTRYARAFATVIADSQLQPPLSIGLFGPWGSGKSFLIDKIKEELKDIEARALADTDSRFCAGLVPVDFNAWHYAETNLWASLFVHILEELGERLNSGRDRGSPMQQRGRVLAQIGRTYAQLRDAEADAAHADAEAVRFRKLQEMTREEGKNSALVTTLLGAVKETLSWNEGSYRPLEDAAAPAYQAAEKRLGELEVEINEFGEIGSNIFTIIRRAIHLPFWQIFLAGARDRDYVSLYAFNFVRRV
jgi:hypothetical protein